MEGIWDANRKLDRIVWMLGTTMKKRKTKRTLLTAEERAEFALHQRQLKERIDHLKAQLATAQKQQQAS